MKVTLLKGVKYKGEPYKAGESIEVDSKHIAELIEKQVVPADTVAEDVQEDDKPTRGKRKKDAEAEGDADTTPEG